MRSQEAPKVQWQGSGARPWAGWFPLHSEGSSGGPQALP